LPVNAGLWPNSRAPQRAKLHGAAWQRDGFGAPNSMNSTRRRQRLTGQQSDIEDPFVAGLSGRTDMARSRLYQGSTLMPLHRNSRDLAFDPEQNEAMRAAFYKVCHALLLTPAEAALPWLLCGRCLHSMSALPTGGMQRRIGLPACDAGDSSCQRREQTDRNPLRAPAIHPCDRREVGHSTCRIL
jgi:hypothetical protein